MLSKLIPVLFLIGGAGAGIGAGLMLGTGGPDPEAPVYEEKSAAKETAPQADAQPLDRGDVEYVKLTNQFVVPIVRNDSVASLIVLSLSLETHGPMTETVFAREPKLRDGFLRVMFDHAHMGGFSGAFTKAENMEILRAALRDVARAELGGDVLDVLIVDIARQDV